VTLSNPFPNGLLQPVGNSLGALTGVGGTINFIDQDKKAPKVHMFSVDINRELPHSIAVDSRDRIYVAGGRPPRGNDFAVYNATSNTWQTLPNLPTQRNHLAACAIDGKIYVVGGRLQAGFTSAMTNILEVFDPTTTNWTTRAPMPTTRGGINGIAAHGYFFVFGGEGPNGVFDEMEMYVPEQNRWYALEPLPIAVHGVTGAAYVNGWIHLPGGGTSTGGSSGATLHQVFWVNGINP